MIIAFDKKSQRRIDIDGKLHVENCNISKADVNDYIGKEIPGYKELGLDENKIYRLLRDPKELKKATQTFERMQILYAEHIPVSAENPQTDIIVGTVGSDVYFNGTYLKADLTFWDEKAIAAIETNTIKELSCAYRYKPIMESGDFNGKKYDGRMTDITGNHLALVKSGRAGSDVVVADNNPFYKENQKMLKKKEDVKKVILAKDATLSPQQLDNVIDALLDVEQDPNPSEPAPQSVGDDGSPHEKMKALLSGKVDKDTINAACALIPTQIAKDEEDNMKKDNEEDNMKKDNEKPAMDAAIKAIEEKNKLAMDAAISSAVEDVKKNLTDKFNAIEKAKIAVRPIVGDVLGMDSAESIYKFALDHLKADYEGVTDAAALAAIVKAYSMKNAMATDSSVNKTKDTVAAIPGLSRFM